MAVVSRRLLGVLVAGRVRRRAGDVTVETRVRASVAGWPSGATTGEVTPTLRRRLKVASRAVAHTIGEGVEHAVSSHHRRRLRKVGWEHAFDASEIGYGGCDLRATVGEPRRDPRRRLELPAGGRRGHRPRPVARAPAGLVLLAQLNLTREEEPVVLRNLLSTSRATSTCVCWSGRVRRSPCFARHGATSSRT